MRKKFYLTTALPYVNSVPHLGFALEIIQADVVARYQRFLGKEVFFLTGTDENSLKNVQAAKREGISTQELVDKNAKKFYQLKEILNISFDDFIRTTEERHIKGAQKLWLACKKDIYKKEYEGLYCVGCEEFYKKEELVDGLCPEHKTKPQLVKEENYFFRLSRYQEKLRKIIERNEIEIIPEKRKNEVLQIIKGGLQDICISRSAKRAHGWGIDVPGDSSQKIWVWLDALGNYITALEYEKEGERFKRFWSEDTEKLHIIGKGILRFHAIYWPAFLLSANLSLPNKIVVHGYLTIEGEKMSKSLGNVVQPEEVVRKYGRTPLRYFLLREIPSMEDGDFTFEKLKKRYEGDLRRGLGNLVARVIALIERFEKENGKIEIEEEKVEVKRETKKAFKEWKKRLDNFKFNEALIIIWELISFCDKYLEETKPWKLFKELKKNSSLQKLKNILLNLLFALKEIAKMLSPFLPETSEKILKQIEKRKKEILFPPLK